MDLLPFVEAQGEIVCGELAVRRAGRSRHEDELRLLVQPERERLEASRAGPFEVPHAIDISWRSWDFAAPRKRSTACRGAAAPGRLGDGAPEAGDDVEPDLQATTASKNNRIDRFTGLPLHA